MGKKRFNIFKNWFWKLLAISLVVLTVFVVNTVWFKPFSIDHFYERLLFGYAMRHPESASKFPIFKHWKYKFFINDYKELLDDCSDAGANKEMNQLFRDMEMLHTYKYHLQSKSQQLSTRTLERYLEIESLKRDAFEFDFPLNPVDGVHLTFPQLLVFNHSIEDLSEAVAYQERLVAFKNKAEQLIEKLAQREALNIPPPPTYLLEESIRQMQTFISPPPNENFLYLNFAKKILDIPNIGISQSDESKLRRDSLYMVDLSFEMNSETSTRIEEVVYPSYKALIQSLKNLLPKSVPADSIGIWAIDDNSGSYYAYLLKKYTSLDTLSADYLLMKGQRSADSLAQQIDLLLTSMKAAPAASTGERLANFYAASTVKRDAIKKDLLYFDTTKKDVLRPYTIAVQQAIKEADKLRPFLFTSLPNSKVLIKQMKHNMGSLFPHNYYCHPSPEISKNKEAIYYLNINRKPLLADWELKAFVCGDISLGAHFQLSYQRELYHLPTFRRIIDVPAYQKGWVLYALTLAQESKFFRTTEEKIGFLHTFLRYIVRMNVDIGIHNKHWTRHYAVEYVMKYLATTPEEATVMVNEILVTPCAATSYLAGYHVLTTLREKAKKQLGKQFDLKEFHNFVLANGAIPIDLLVELFDDYIKKQKSM